MSRVLRSIRVTFTREGIEYAVTYAHDGEQSTPGTKKRTTTAARMARKGLEAALGELGNGAELCWGGFAQGRAEATDRVLVERKEHAA